MSARSTSVTLVNSTKEVLLKYVDANLDHGAWTAQPPNEIGPNSTGQWESESDGFLTGTEGWVRYYPIEIQGGDEILIPSPVPPEATVYIYWDNPYAGDNSYAETTPSYYAVAQRGDGSGDNASVEFDFGGAYGPDTCCVPYVWREAGPDDHVCVTPETRAQAQADNAQAASRRNPDGGPYGPDTCQQGYVWREAFPGDHVCVTPETRAQAQADNALAGSRRM